MKKELEKKHKKAIEEIENKPNDLKPKKIKKRYRQIIKQLEGIPEKQQKDVNKKMPNKRNFSIKQPRIRSKIIGLPLIITGIIFLFHPTLQNLKIGLTITMIGSFLIFIISEKNKISKRTLDSKKNRLLTSEKITIILIIWILFLFIITGENQLETFFVLTFIGILVTKELSDEYITRSLKVRMNVFISIFLLTYVVIIAQKIINILDI